VFNRFRLDLSTSGSTLTIKVYYNGAYKFTATDGSPFAAGPVGMIGGYNLAYWDNVVAITNVSPATVVSYDDYDAWGMILEGRSAVNGDGRPRFKFTGKERDAESKYDYFGARYYDARLGRFVSPDPHAISYPGINPYSYVGNNPLSFIDPTGMDSVYFQDQAGRPSDDRTGETYTANVFVVRNGELVGAYFGGGSTYPNSVSETDNSPAANTVDEGVHPFNNASGHTPKGKSTEKGLNLVNDNGLRVAPGTAPDGSPANGTGEMTQVNVHEGESNNGGPQSRGSAGCLTTKPAVSASFFGHFDWSGPNHVTGNSSGSVFVIRGGGVELPIRPLAPAPFRSRK
jgi:RHS repeat-associated protein